MPEYRRNAGTWMLFAGLLAFGVVNAVLGPALPYLRATEHISYLTGSLHQVAFAVGGGLAGVLAARSERYLSRLAIIRVGLAAAGLAAVGVGYGGRVAVTVAAAFAMSLFGTSALVRIWAALADAHGRRRTVALAEGEVLVSLGGVIAPLLLSGLAATRLSWRFGFVIAGAGAVASVLVMGSRTVSDEALGGRRAPCGVADRGGVGPGGLAEAVRPVARRSAFAPSPTLVVVFAIVALEFSLSFWLASYLNDSVGINRAAAVLMVGGLYAANLCGRVAASRFARRLSAERLLGTALLLTLVGLPVLLAAGTAPVAGVGIAVAGVGVGATFPLTSSLHVAASPRRADAAVGQIMATAAIGQILGPLLAGAIGQAAGLRLGLLVLPALSVVAAVALGRYVNSRDPVS